MARAHTTYGQKSAILYLQFDSHHFVSCKVATFLKSTHISLVSTLLQVQETTTPVSRMVQTVHSEDADLLYMAGKNLQRGKPNHVHVGLALIIVHHSLQNRPTELAS